ncbi:hypothetical protein AHF37_10733 [Paragonimus kellicotti]|nr:hypothetical protein AHF37_10733 [Paragonimus kellicotti]
MRVDHVMISETALRCIIDCLLIVGFRPFHEAKVRPNARASPTDEAAAIAVNEEDADDIDGDDDDVSGMFCLSPVPFTCISISGHVSSSSPYTITSSVCATHVWGP